MSSKCGHIWAHLVKIRQLEPVNHLSGNKIKKGASLIYMDKYQLHKSYHSQLKWYLREDKTTISCDTQKQHLSNTKAVSETMAEYRPIETITEVVNSAIKF